MKIAKIVIFSVSMLAVSGCAAKKKSAEFFTPKQDQAHWNAIAQQQEIASAAADPSLYAADFNGSSLNSLGKQQLDLTQKASQEAKKTVVYLASQANSTGRQTAIRTYLSEHGIPADDIKIILGTNPDSGTLASRNTNDLNKLDSATSATSSENPSPNPATK